MIDGKSNRNLIFWMVALGFSLGFIYAVFVLFVTPKKYESTTVVEFRKPVDLDPSESWSASNEVVVITSGPVLAEVAEKLDLLSKWQYDLSNTAISIKAMITIEPVDDSDFHEITVRQASPILAQDIAQELPEAYCEFKKREQRESLAAQLKNLETEMQGQTDLIKTSESRLKDLLRIAERTADIDTKPQESSMRELLKGRQDTDGDHLRRIVDSYDQEWRSYALESSGLAGLVKERDKTILRKTTPLEPIKVHEEAKYPLSPAFPDIESGLLWGLGKGLIFGIVLGICTLLFQRMKGGPRNLKSREKDPADVW